MITITHKIDCENGLHARPVAELCKVAKSFESSITAVKGSKKANVKSAMKLMLLGAKKGEQLEIGIDGPDENQAQKALDYFFQNVLKHI